MQQPPVTPNPETDRPQPMTGDALGMPVGNEQSETKLWALLHDAAEGNGKLEEAVRTLERLSMIDTEHTHLLNRKGFIYMASHLSEEGDLALFQADMDHFKSINDTLGHAYGDDAIRITGEYFRGLTIRGFEAPVTVARNGGDEFVGVTRLNGKNDDQPDEQRTNPATELDGLSKRLRNGFDEFIKGYEGPLKDSILKMQEAGINLAMSVGVAILPANSDEVAIETAMKEADAIMQDEKTFQHVPGMSHEYAQKVNDLAQRMQELGIDPRVFPRIAGAAAIRLALGVDFKPEDLQK